MTNIVTGIRLTIDPMKHSVTPVTRSDFDAVISKFRDRQIAVVYYYKPDESDSSRYFEAFNSVAADLRGMFKFAGVNCADQAKLCKDEGITSSSEFPVVMVYPLRPLPAEPLPREDLEKLNEDKGLRKTLYRLLSSEHVTTLSEDKLDNFVDSEDHLPRVILFSSKKSTPPLYKALSTEFSKEMHFGFFPSPSEAVLKRFKIKGGESGLPKLILQESGHGKKTQTYDGDLNFSAIHEWINLRRETFARGGGFDHTAATGGDGGADGSKPTTPSKPIKPWLSQEIPEVYKQSHKDVCFKHDEGLCVIYLKEGSELSAEETSMLKSLKSSTADESIKFRFMWMDMSTETEFKDLFKPESLPNVVIFNPHKRLRFTTPLEDAIESPEPIANLIDKIVAGEGRFKMVPGQELPAFVDRKKQQGVKEEL